MNTEGGSERGNNNSTNIHDEVINVEPTSNIMQGQQNIYARTFEQGESSNRGGRQSFQEPLTATSNVEQQRVIYVPDPDVRESMENRVQIAWERQRSGQPLRMEDVMAIDYYQLVLRHLHPRRYIPNKNMTRHLDQSNLSQNEPRWLQYLNNRLRWREGVLNNISHEIFAPVHANRANRQSCCICLGNYRRGEDIGKLNCAHRFHWNCIQEWLVVRNVCPLCIQRGLSFD